jgi:DNA polymerase-3 subunit gamma/tau
MAYVPLTLKYRPQRFEDVVAQRHVSQTLMHAVAGGRLVHAYLFAGPRGTGKTTTARLLAMAINCLQGPTPTPCGQCSVCVSIRDGHALDVIEIDAASNRGIDEIRDLREKVKYSPAEARAKVYILDEVHMLTKEAFNALLKTLEEPPAHAFFVLATTEPHRVPATIMSRCQRFDFRLIPTQAIVEALKPVTAAEGIAIEPEALESIARAAGGAMRDALSILDQAAAFSEGAVTLEHVTQVLGATEARLVGDIAAVLIRRDAKSAFEAVNRLVNEGKDIGQLLSDLVTYLRNLLLLTLRADAAMLDVPAAERQRLQEWAAQTSAARVLGAIEVLTEAQAELRVSSQDRIVVELALARICAGEETAPAAEPTAAVAATAEPAPKPTAAEPAPGPTAAVPPSGPLDFAGIAGRWPAVMEELSGSVKACLHDGKPTAYGEGVLTVTFSKQFHHDQVADRYKFQVERALRAVLGQEVKLKTALELRQAPPEQPSLLDRRAETESGPPAAVQETAQPPSDEAAATVDDVLSLFPGSSVLDEE